jgi:putative PIN family toxin of toxin-antitoxin system
VRIVIDASILIRSFANPQGPAQSLLSAVLSGDHALILSSEILHETARALRYPHMLAARKYTEEEVYHFVESLKQSAEMVPPNPLIRAPIRDSNDIHVLQTAVMGWADVLCTYDRDFFEPPAGDFLEKCGITVLSDVQLLRRLRQ